MPTTEELYRRHWITHVVPYLFKHEPDALSNRWYDLYADFEEACAENAREWAEEEKWDEEEDWDD